MKPGSEITLSHQLSNLASFHNKIDMIRATAKQISKDFEIFGEVITFSGNADTAYAELSDQISSISKKMMAENFEKFLSLLYRIDISENSVKKILTEYSGNFEIIIAEMIIERELKKIIIRKYYSEKK